MVAERPHGLPPAITRVDDYYEAIVMELRTITAELRSLRAALAPPDSEPSGAGPEDPSLHEGSTG